MFSRLVALTALLISVLAMPVSAQVTSRALPTESLEVPILGTGTAAGPLLPTVLVSGASVVSGVIENPAEITAIDYDATGSTVGIPAPTITVKYSDSAAGPFVAGVGSGFDNTVSMTVTPTSGCDVILYPAKYAQFTYANVVTGSSPVTNTLVRLTGRRTRVSSHSGSRRPQAMVDSVFTFDDLTGAVIATGNTPQLLPLVDAAHPTKDLLVEPDTIVGFQLYTSASGTKKVQIRYSNDPAGPYNVWEDVHSLSYINEVSTTAASASFAPIKAFPSEYYKVDYKNSTGGNTTVTRLSQLSRRQSKR